MTKLGTFAKLFPAIALISALSLLGGVAVADDQGSSEVVAEVGGHKITKAELDQNASDKMNSARSQVVQAKITLYEAEKSALDKAIDKEVLTQEAAKEHITGDQLLKREVEGKVKDPSEETLRIYYLGIPGNKDPYEAMRGKILHSIRALEEKQAADDYIKRLREARTIKIDLLPPRQDVAIGDTPAVGPADAPVTFIEFADFQCPYCRQEETTLKQLREQFKDKIRFAYRDFPLPMHPFAHKAAEAARCAGEQGRFWPYHDRLFSGAPDELAVPGLKASARQVGLDGDKFDKCLDSGAEAAAVDADFNSGKALGITGTPTMYVNGYTVSGAAALDTLHDLVQEQIDSSQEKKAADSGSKPQAKAKPRSGSQMAGLN
jgi:protein-disulfide isomerase